MTVDKKISKTFHAKVVEVQSELKAPKGKTNSFGGFTYRSASDILEAVKPLLYKRGIIISLSDEVVNIGGANYVKATAQITDGTDQGVSTAYAREAVTKKGMDEAQITGSASSYARKYALSGLFAIDDAAADPDGHDNREHKPEAPKKNPEETTEPPVDELAALKGKAWNLLKQNGFTEEKLRGEMTELFIGKKQPTTIEDFKQLIEALDNYVPGGSNE